MCPPVKSCGFLEGFKLKRQTKLISLLVGLAASTVAVSVPASADPSNFVLISNRDGDAHVISIAEHTQNGTLVRSETWTIGATRAHYWVINPGDYVNVKGPDGFSESLPATSLPHCYRINEGADMHTVPGNCNTRGATSVWGG
jgi:hypothetical protein